MDRVLRYYDRGTQRLGSDLLQLCPANFADRHDPQGSARRRRLRHHAQLRPQPARRHAVALMTRTLSAYTVAASAEARRCPSPTWPQRTPCPARRQRFHGGLACRCRHPQPLDLNRPLPPFPHQGSGSSLSSGPALVPAAGRFDSGSGGRPVQNALAERQRLANDIYRQFLAVTGVPRSDPASRPTAGHCAAGWPSWRSTSSISSTRTTSARRSTSTREADVYPRGRPAGSAAVRHWRGQGSCRDHSTGFSARNCRVWW